MHSTINTHLEHDITIYFLLMMVRTTPFICCRSSYNHVFLVMDATNFIIALFEFIVDGVDIVTLCQVGPSPLSSSLQPPTMYGMPPPIGSQTMAAMPPAGSHIGGPAASKVDPSQIPRPIPTSSIMLYETRHGNQANPPPVLL